MGYVVVFYILNKCKLPKAKLDLEILQLNANLNPYIFETSRKLLWFNLQTSTRAKLPGRKLPPQIAHCSSCLLGLTIKQYIDGRLWDINLEPWCPRLQLCGIFLLQNKSILIILKQTTQLKLTFCCKH